MSGSTQSAAESLWTPQSVVALAVLAIVAGTVAGVFVVGDTNTRNIISSLVVGSGLGGVCGFYFGSSKGSQAKDVLLAAQPTKGPTP